MIRNLIFGSKLIDFETSEVEFKFKKFWLNLEDDENSQTEGFQKYLDIDQAYPSAEETLKKRSKRQRLIFPEKLWIYKQVVIFEGSNSFDCIQLSSSRSNNQRYCKENRSWTFEQDEYELKY